MWPFAAVPIVPQEGGSHPDSAHAATVMTFGELDEMLSLLNRKPAPPPTPRATHAQARSLPPDASSAVARVPNSTQHKGQYQHPSLSTLLPPRLTSDSVGEVHAMGMVHGADDARKRPLDGESLVSAFEACFGPFEAQIIMDVEELLLPTPLAYHAPHTLPDAAQHLASPLALTIVTGMELAATLPTEKLHGSQMSCLDRAIATAQGHGGPTHANYRDTAPGASGDGRGGRGPHPTRGVPTQHVHNPHHHHSLPPDQGSRSSTHTRAAAVRLITHATKRKQRTAGRPPKIPKNPQQIAPLSPRLQKRAGKLPAGRAPSNHTHTHTCRGNAKGNLLMPLPSPDGSGTILPTGHIVARGRRRTRQLATMTPEQIAVEADRQREKNRLLAIDIRRRKKMKIALLEEKVAEYELVCSKQATHISRLEAQVANLWAADLAACLQV